MRVFLLLPVIYLVALIGVPIVYNTAMSLQEVNLGNIADFSRPFVGLENFTDALADPVFRQVLGNSAVFVVANVVGQAGIGAIAGHDQRRRPAIRSVYTNQCLEQELNAL